MLDTVTSGNLIRWAAQPKLESGRHRQPDIRSHRWDHDCRTANSQNELTGVGSSLTYDLAGNTTTDENGQTYIYNAWNQVITAKDSGGATIAGYAYDVQGRRISQTEAGATTQFYFSSQGQTIEDAKVRLLPLKMSGTSTT